MPNLSGKLSVFTMALKKLWSKVRSCLMTKKTTTRNLAQTLMMGERERQAPFNFYCSRWSSWPRWRSIAGATCCSKLSSSWKPVWLTSISMMMSAKKCQTDNWSNHREPLTFLQITSFSAWPWLSAAFSCSSRAFSWQVRRNHLQNFAFYAHLPPDVEDRGRADNNALSMICAPFLIGALEQLLISSLKQRLDLELR